MGLTYEEIKAGQKPFQEAEIENGGRIRSIFHSIQQDSDYIRLSEHNQFDIDWLKEKLSGDEFERLESNILEYASRNDENVFTMGFKYAWSLFFECMKDI